MKWVIVVLFLCSAQVRASIVLFGENFELYNLGILDKNISGTANPAPNGSGNPWWGPPTGTPVGPFVGTPSSIVGAENGVTPHSGSQMLRGTHGSGEISQVWNNIAYRDNGGAVFSGNLVFNFWFYDTAGAANGVNFGSTAALTFYADNVSTTDYPASQTLNKSNGNTIERLQLGGTDITNNTAGFPQTYNSSDYQARVIGSTVGYNNVGWINLPLTRSIGWHNGQIVVGPPDANHLNVVSFYIDDLSTPLLTAKTTIGHGYSDAEITSVGTAVAYFDDLTLATPEPASFMQVLISGAAWLVWRRQRAMKRGRPFHPKFTPGHGGG